MAVCARCLMYPCVNVRVRVEENVVSCIRVWNVCVRVRVEEKEPGQVLPSDTLQLILEMNSLPEPRAHQFGKISWLANPRGSSCLCLSSRTAGLIHHSQLLNLVLEIQIQGSRCTAGIFPTEPSSQPVYCLLVRVLSHVCVCVFT